MPEARMHAVGLRERLDAGDALERDGEGKGDAERVTWKVEAAGEGVAVPQPLLVTEGLLLLVSVELGDMDGVPDPQMLSVTLALGCAVIRVRLPLGERVALCVGLTVRLPPAVGSVREALTVRLPVPMPLRVLVWRLLPQAVYVREVHAVTVLVLHPLPVLPAVGSVRVTVPVRVTERVRVPEPDPVTVRVAERVMVPEPDLVPVCVTERVRVPEPDLVLVPPAVGSVRVTVAERLPPTEAVRVPPTLGNVRVTERVKDPERVLVTVPVRVTERVKDPDRVLVTVPVRVTERVLVPDPERDLVGKLLVDTTPPTGCSRSVSPTPRPTPLPSSSDAVRVGAKYHAVPPGTPSGPRPQSERIRKRRRRQKERGMLFCHSRVKEL